MNNEKNNNSVFEKYRQIVKLNKVIIDEFIDRIEIVSLDKKTNTRNIEIKWNFD